MSEQTLAEREATVARMCLAPTPATEDLDTLGSPDRWQIYRRMVRARMHRVCETALKLSRAAYGEEAFTKLVDEWLAAEPPTTRFFRELPNQMARWALSDEGRLVEPAHLRDLLRYEDALWAVRAEDDRDLPEVVDFSFEGVPAFNPSSRFLPLEWGVDKRADDGSVEPLEGALLVYRTAGFTVPCMRLNPLAAAIVRELRDAQEAGRAVTEAVQRAAASEKRAVDQKFIESLSGLLEKLITRGIVRGCLK
ncbi:MAG: putative DNA-binding domain-containing protein [Deltaproteobacteria bacterium]|nr:putative DNA-binding domain-containing protein [Deltaproteobacteria bacterium]